MAHGLVLRMQDMVEYRRNDKVSNEQGSAYAEYASTGDVNLPKLWTDAVEFPNNSKPEYLTLLRKTLIFMFSPKWTMYSDKGDLQCAIKYHYRAFSNITENVSEIFNSLLNIFKKDPWKNTFFMWNDLFDGTITIYDERVQDYLESEPEEVVLARVHALFLRNRASDAMCLAKTSFLYHSRVIKSFRSSRKHSSTSGFSASGHASIDWFFSLLELSGRSRAKYLDFIVNEVRQLECHEGVEILFRLWRDPKYKPLCYTLLKMFLLLDLIQSSKYCCTKRLFKIFCMMHEELHSSPKEIAESCHKLISKHAPSSVHFYLLVDVLWRQFGMKCLELYVDLYVRGLTADINHLENKRHLEAFSDAESLEIHSAAVFEKLSTLFKNLNPAVARECMFSAFSLQPTKERLYSLQGLSQSLSNSNKNIHKSLLTFDFSSDCNCGLRCIGHCRDALNKSSFVHPLLSISIGNISHVVKRDFISVLENVRHVTFQYNVFDWRSDLGKLGNYLIWYSQRVYSQRVTLEKSESDTESGDEIYESGMGNIKTVSKTTNDLKCQFKRSSIKRKSGSDCLNEISPLNTGENVVVQADDFTCKRIKTAKPSVEMSVTVSSNNQQVIQGIFNNSLENVIRMSLNNNPAKSWSDSMDLLNVNNEHITNDLNSSKSSGTENSFQSCFSERNIPNNQRYKESNSNFSLHYSDKTHLQISATLQYDNTQKSIAVAHENNTSFKQLESSEHQNILKSHLAHKSSAKTSDFAVTHPCSENFSNQPHFKYEKRSSQEMTNFHLTAKSDRERHVHNHHLHSSPFVSSQPPPKSFSKHQLNIHPLAEVKTQTTIPSQEVKDSVPCDSTRKSVIVNVKGKPLQLANQSPFLVNQSVIQENEIDSQEDGSKLQFYRINVPKKYLDKPDKFMAAQLVIPYKKTQISVKDSEVESAGPDLVVPGIMAPAYKYKNTSQYEHAKKLSPAIISDGTLSASGLQKVSSESGKAQLFHLKPCSDLVLKRNAGNKSEFGTAVLKPLKEFKELVKNNLKHTVTNKGVAYSNTQQLDSSLDSKLKWKMGHVHDSHRSQMTFHPISDSHSAPVSTNSQPWYSSPHPKTSSNSPVSFSTHRMNTPKASSNSPVTSRNSPLSFSVQRMKIPKTNCNSPVSFSVHNMNSMHTSSNSPLHSSVYKMNTPQAGSNSPVSFPVHNVKPLESFGVKKVSTYTDANSQNYSSGNNVQNKPSLSFLKSRLTSMHNTQLYSDMSAYSCSKPNSFSAHDKTYSESHEPSQNPFDVKNISERSTHHSFISSVNMTSNSLSSQIQSNISSVYNPVYPSNDRRVIVQDARNLATSSSSSNVQNKSSAFSQQCCSSFEVNPCDTCSSKTSNQFLTKTQVIGFPSSPVENLHNQVTDAISSDDKCFEASQNMQQQTETEEPQKMCTFCSYLFPASLMKTHIENTHQEELLTGVSYNIQNQILRKETSFSVSNSEGISIINYDSQNENQISLENNIHNTCNTAVENESSQNTDQFISSLLDFIGPSFDKSIEGSFENTGNSHPINTNESPCDNSKSESLSEMLKEVDFSRNISSDLSAICDGNELSYDMIENKQPNVENVSNENKDMKSWYNNLSLDLLNNDDKPGNEMVNFKISEYDPQSSEISNVVQKKVILNETGVVNEQTSEDLKSSYEIFRTVEPLEKSDLVHNIQKMDEIGNFQNVSSQPLKNVIICPICKKKLDFDVDLQQHINIYHSHISGDKMVFNELNPSNNSNMEEGNGLKNDFTPCSFITQENKTEIFDFDSYLPDNAAKEVYRPLQKGKSKLYSNSSCNSENSMLNTHTELNAQETNYEIPTSKKKGRREICIICKKVYSKNYLKIHHRKEHMKDQHGNCFKMSENSSNLSLSGQTVISSSTPEQNQSFSCISDTLLQEDIDTRTCLSTSDALNSGYKFEGSDVKKTSCGSRNKIVQLEQKYPFHSVSDSVKESSVSTLNSEKLEKPAFTILKEEKLNSKLRNTFDCKPKRAKRYQCNWIENQNYCDQKFSSKCSLLKHLKTGHILGNKCHWFLNNNYCNQEFPSVSLLLKHLKSEHMIKKSFECDIQQSIAQKNVTALERSQQMKENSLFNNSTDNKGSDFVLEDLLETQMLKPKSDLLSVNLNPGCRKVENVNSVLQFNSDKAIPFSQNEHALPSEQVCPENLDNQLYNIPERDDNCHPSPKSFSRLCSSPSVDESGILSSVLKMSPKQSDASNSVGQSCSVVEVGLLDSFKETKHEVNVNSLSQKIYERFDEVLSYKCHWYQNNNYCNQEFPSQSLLIKHMRDEHMKKKSYECDNLQGMTQTVERSQQMKENGLFNNSMANKGSVFAHEDLQELKPKSDIPSMNVNHVCRKVENNVNSVMQFNSDKAISFSLIEHVLSPEQDCPENLNNQLYNKISEKHDSKCHLSAKSVSHFCIDSSIDESDILSTVEKMSSIRNDTSISVNKICEKSLNKTELSDIPNSFKETRHEVDANSLPQKIYERYDNVSFVSDTKKISQHGFNSVQNSDLNENPSESYDCITKDIDSNNGNSNSSSKTDYFISDLFQNFEGRNKLLNLKAQSVGEIIGDEKHNDEVVDAAKSTNFNKLRSPIPSKQRGNQSSVKKTIDICDTSLLKNSPLNFKRESPITNSDPVKCHASSALQLLCNKELHAPDSASNKQAVINSECAPVKQQVIQDNDENKQTSHKQISSVASDKVSIDKGNRLCKKKTGGELVFNFEKSAARINYCTELTNLEMQASSSPESQNNQDSELIENSRDSVGSYCTKYIQEDNQSNATQLARVVDESPLTALPKNSQFDAIADNIEVNNSENCTDNLTKLKDNLDFQTQLTIAHNSHESISTNNLIDEKQNVDSNKPVSSVGKRSNSLSNLSESDEKGMPNLVPEFDFKSLLVNEKIKTDENTLVSEKGLKNSDINCFPYEMPPTNDVSCPSDNVIAVSSAGTHTIDNLESFCVSSISLCSYPKVLTSKDSKDNENSSLLNEDYSIFSSVDSLQDLPINEVGLLESIMNSKSDGMSAEPFNDSSCNQRIIVESATMTSCSVRDFEKKSISNDKSIESCSELMDSEKPVDNQFSEIKQLQKSFALSNGISIFQEQTFELEIKETINDMVDYIISCENAAFLNFENYKTKKSFESRIVSTEMKTSPDAPVFANFSCGENSFSIQELCNKKAITVPCDSNTKTVEKASVVCRECNEVFPSDEVLSDHLEFIHDLPHLKKQISEFRKKSNVDKLSPPPLYFHSVCDYDSASASAESSPNKCSEEDNCKSYKNVSPEETSNPESEPSLSESGTNIGLEQIKSSKSSQSSSVLRQLSTKLRCEKGPIINRSRHQNEKHNKRDASSKIRKRISNKKTSFNVVSDPLNKDLVNKNAALPKCIIKVLKDDQNSVIYKIDNSPDMMSERNAQAEWNSFDTPKYTDINSNTAAFNHQFFESSKSKQAESCQKLEKCFKSNCDPYSPDANSGFVLSTENKEFCKKTNKNGVFLMLNSKKRTKQKVNKAVITLKSKDFKQFIIDNKQPYVLVTRLDPSLLNSANISALKQDISYINFICKKPVVRVKRIKFPDVLYENNVHLPYVNVVVPKLPNIEAKELEASSTLSNLRARWVKMNR